MCTFPIQNRPSEAASLTLMCAARLNRDDAKLVDEIEVDEVELDVPDPPR